MSDNNFITSIERNHKQKFSRRFRLLLGFSILLTGMESIGMLLAFPMAIASHFWSEISIIDFSRQLLMWICDTCIFISLIRIAIDKTPFSKIILLCTRIIGILWLLASFIFPRLPDYHSSGIEILSQGSFVLIDGKFLIIGLLAILLSCLIQEGFQMKTDLDEIL